MKEQPDVPKALAEVFKRLGGIAEMAKWAKSHKTFFYNHYVKMLPTQVSAQVDVQVNDNVIRDQAMQKLQSAFEALLEAERDDAAEAEARTGIRIIDGLSYARITDQSNDGGLSTIADQSSGTGPSSIDKRREADVDATYTRIADQPTRTADTSTRDARHGAVEDQPTSTAEDQNKNPNHPRTKGSLGHGGPRSPTTVRARPVSVEPTTTQLFFESNGGGGRKFWGPVGEGGGMP